MYVCKHTYIEAHLLTPTELNHAIALAKASAFVLLLN